MKKTDSVSNLVIGLGQIGKAIQSILNCEGIDKNQLVPKADVIHICFPYSKTFIKDVKKYQKQSLATLTVIHSTVKVGTTSKIPNAVYSPCRGVHPYLEKGIRTFVKYFAGEEAGKAAKIFSDKDVESIYSNGERTIQSLEAAKLWDTTIYGINILIEKEIHKYCEDNQLDFELVYTHFNETYNQGYDKLGMPQYKKYVLKHQEGKIGGHCVIPNSKLLDSKLAKLLHEA